MSIQQRSKHINSYDNIYLNSWHKDYKHPKVRHIPEDEEEIFYPNYVSFFGGMWFNYTKHLNQRYSHRLMRGTFHNKFIYPSVHGFKPPVQTIKTLSKYMLVLVYRNDNNFYDYNPAIQESGTKIDNTFEEIVDRGMREELGYKINEIIPGSKSISYRQKRRNIMFVAVKPSDLEYLEGVKPKQNNLKNDKKRKAVIYITSDNYQDLINIARNWKPFIQTETQEVLDTVGMGIKLTSQVIREFKWYENIKL